MYQKQLKRSTGKVVKKVKKNHHYVAQASILFVVGLLVLVSNFRSNDAPSVSYSTGFGTTNSSTVDEVASVGVAAQIARNGNLIVADNVSNLADSLNAKVTVATTSESYLEKPQIVTTESNTRQSIIEYITKDGDSVSSVAREFNITSDTIRWANNLTGEALGAGKKLIILPISGILYTVKEGDTAESLAARYGANAERIITFNNAEISGLVVGSRIVIPEGERPTPQVASTSGGGFSGGGSASSSFGYSFGSSPLYGGNGYSYGYCTWWAANRREQIGKPIPRNFGNANTWASLAQSAGFAVDGSPRTGDVLWHKNTYIAGGYGHVAFVESVNPDGSILVSDMNYGGWNTVTQRTIKPSEFGLYLFIH